MQTLMLGIGDELLGTEGFRVHAAQLLREESLPKQTKRVKVGTAILGACPRMPYQIWNKQI